LEESSRCNNGHYNDEEGSLEAQDGEASNIVHKGEWWRPEKTT